MSTKRTAPPYSEAEATAWLAWLAFNMQQRDLTIFQIESLQPDWLTDAKERVPHLLLTRMIWSLLVIMIFIALLQSLIRGNMLIIWLVLPIAALIFGLILGLSELIIPMHKLDAFLRNRVTPIWSTVAGTLIYGIIYGLIFGAFGMSDALSEGLSDKMRQRLSGLLVWGLALGFVRTLLVARAEGSRSIRTIESLDWSWRHVRKNAKKGSLFGLISGLILGPVYALVDGLSAGLTFMLRGGLILGLIGGLIGGLLGGFQPGVEELKTRPNQGIWLTIRSAFKIGLVVGCMIGAIVWLLSQSIALGLMYGILIALIIGSWYGGLDAIEHGIVRLIIAWRGHAPLNYARFLDYAAEELNFLQKIGGGYVFIHRYLLEHFAEIAVEKGYVTPTAEKQ